MKIGIFGGDKRMLFTAQAFVCDGHEVLLAGFDSLVSLCDIRICSVQEAADECDCAVLPIRPIVDGDLNAPFSAYPIRISDLTERIGEKPIFTGSSQMLLPFAKGKVYDYTVCEAFQLRNAQLTAEGAIGLILHEYEGAVYGTDMLITGYGRIGKALSRCLDALGANITVAARRFDDRVSITHYGMTAADYPDLDYALYRVIINTVPAMVLDQDAVDQMREDVFIIDLASVPGGVDFHAARDRELTCIHATALPGKTAPLTAGIIIKDTIMNILKREAALG